MTYNDQTGTTYTLVSGDVGKIVRLTNAGAITVIVPPSVFAQGDVIGIVQGGAGQVTIAPGSGVTINSSSSLKTFGEYAVCGLVCSTASTGFDFTGDRG